MATEPIEKKVTSRDIPCGSAYFQLWQGEEVDFTILSHYFEAKSPITPLLQNPQTRQFTISLEPSKHFILPRASYITFETRIVPIDGNEHKKLPPVTPPKLQTFSDSPHEKTSYENAPLRPANDSGSPNGIDQSEVKSSSPLIQRHFSHGTKFVLEPGQRPRPEDVGQQGTSQGAGNVDHNTDQMRLSAQEIEKRKEQERVKMKRMEKWIKQQDEQRRRNMIERQGEQRDEDERQQKRCGNEEFPSKRHRPMSKCIPTKVRKLTGGSTTSESDTLERRSSKRRSEKKRKETLLKKTTPSNADFLGVNYDNAVSLLFCTPSSVEFL